MNQIDINTSQNVNIRFTLASVGERIAAFVIDSLIIAAYYITLFLILTNFRPFDQFLNRRDNWEVMAILGILSLPATFYTLVCETFMEGQTFGKKAMGIKVVKIDGYQCNFGTYFVRWMLRPVEIYIFSGLPAFVSTIISKKNQRLGDMVADTAVIYIRNKVNISHTILENISTDYKPLFPQVVALSDNDIRIIKENLTKAIQSNDRVVISKLEAKVKDILKLEYDEEKLTKRMFLKTIITDYNYYTGKD